MPSKIKKYNFCCPEHRAVYQRSSENKDFGKGWKHTPEEIEKISQASLSRNYDDVLTNESRQKMAIAARNRVWTDEQREQARQRKLGKRNTEEQNRKIKEHGRYGEDNNMWGGDFVTLQAMHMWVVRHKGKAGKCVDEASMALHCKGRYEWSNFDHKYRRVLEDYSERCTRHHRIYDAMRGLTNPKQKARRFFAKAGKLRERVITIDGIIIADENIVPNVNYL